MLTFNVSYLPDDQNWDLFLRDFVSFFCYFLSIYSYQACDRKKIPNHKTEQKSITFLRSSDITNLRKDYYKIAQVLQICAKSITNLHRYFKSAQLLQICAQQGVLSVWHLRVWISMIFQIDTKVTYHRECYEPVLQFDQILLHLSMH